MVIPWLLVVALTGAPAPYLLPPAPAGPLGARVWPVLAGMGAAVPSQAVPGDAIPGAVGFVFATLPDAQTLRLHRIRVVEGLEITSDLPWTADDAALAEAIRLRVAFVLEAPPEAGQPWRPPSLTPPPPESPLPPERLADLRVARPPPPPGHTSRVPSPPGVDPPPGPADPRLVEAPAPVTDGPGAGRFRLGVESLADLDGASLGLLLGAAFEVAPGWRVAVDAAAHPFHDFRRGGRPLGVTAARVAARALRAIGHLGPAEASLAGGVFGAWLTGAGAGLDTGDARGGVSAGGLLDLPLGGPLSATAGLDLLAALASSEARYGDEVLLQQGPLELRAHVVIGWALW
ncbi:MAG: hypothetical protein H6706_26970 [Myxococcales bacterium]|nr:hypothetical protein [Myxococcales bacterium]